MSDIPTNRLFFYTAVCVNPITANISIWRIAAKSETAALRKIKKQYFILFRPFLDIAIDEDFDPVLLQPGGYHQKLLYMDLIDQ